MKGMNSILTIIERPKNFTEHVKIIYGKSHKFVAQSAKKTGGVQEG